MTRWQRDPDFVLREVQGQRLLIPLGPRAGRVMAFLLEGEVAPRLWAALDGPRSEQELQDLVVGEFAVEPGEALADLREFLGQLERAGCARQVD